MTTMRRVMGVAAMSIALALGGCGPEGPTKSDTGLAVGAIAGGLLGNTVGKGGGRAAATIVGAVVGGIVGSEIGRSMDEQDRRLAQRAEYDAFESGPSGRPVHWKNPDNGRYGDVVPAAPYRRGEFDCRDYTHTIYIDGRPREMRGTACRNPDGSWRNVG
jgi:surface antigen